MKATLAKIFPPNASDTQATIQKLKDLFGEEAIAPWLSGGTNAEQSVNNMLENIEQGIEKIGPSAGLDFLRKLGVQNVPTVAPVQIDHGTHVVNKLHKAEHEEDTSFISPSSILNALVAHRVSSSAISSDPKRKKDTIAAIGGDQGAEKYLKDPYRTAWNNLDRAIRSMQDAGQAPQTAQLDQRRRLSTLLDATGNDFLKQYLALKAHKRGGLNKEFLRKMFSELLEGTLSRHTPRKEFFDGKYWEHLKHDAKSTQVPKFMEELDGIPEDDDPRVQKFLDALNARISEDQPSE